MGFSQYILAGLIACMYQSPSVGAGNQVVDVHSARVTIMVGVDEGDFLSVSSEIIRVTENDARCAGSLKSKDGSWGLDWNLILDLDAREGGKIRGATVIKNFSSQSRAFHLRVLFPLDPLIQGHAEMQSEVEIELAADGQPGRAEVSRNGSGWRMLIDGKNSIALINSPFFLVAKNSEKVRSPARTGPPNTWRRVDGVMDSIGTEHQWVLHPGNTLTIHTNLQFRGEADRFLKRRSISAAVVIRPPDEVLRITTGRAASRGSSQVRKTITVRPRISRDGNKIHRNE